MKKITMILLLGVISVLLVGCGPQPIDYEGIVQIEQSLTYNLGETPTQFDQFVVIDEDYKDQVVSIFINTDKVDFDEAGDYPIYVTVEYSDGETKIFYIVLFISSPTPADPVILGVKNLLVPLYTKDYDLEEDITYYDEGTIENSSVSGTVDYNNEGYLYC